MNDEKKQLDEQLNEGKKEERKYYCSHCQKEVNGIIDTLSYENGNVHWTIVCAECGELLDED